MWHISGRAGLVSTVTIHVAHGRGVIVLLGVDCSYHTYDTW